MQTQNSYDERPTTWKAWANGNISIPHGYRRPKTESDFSLLDNFKGKRDHKKKTYKLTNQNRKTFISRAVVAQLRSRRKMITMLLTYPADKVVNDPYADLNRFITNLRKTYGLKTYLSALELTKKGQWHFHMLMDLPFTDAQKLTDAWNSAAGIVSNNSVRDLRKIKHPKGAISYCASYMKKEDSKNHDKRKFSYSKDLVNTEKCEIDEADLYNDRIKVIQKRRFDYCTVIQVALTDSFLNNFKVKKRQIDVKNTYKPPENTCMDVKNTYVQVNLW